MKLRNEELGKSRGFHVPNGAGFVYVPSKVCLVCLDGPLLHSGREITKKPGFLSEIGVWRLGREACRC